VAFGHLGTSFVLPLLLSPVVSLLLTVLLYPLFHWARRASGATRQTCICIGGATEEVRQQPDGTLLLVRTGAILEVAEAPICVERYQGQMWGAPVGTLLDGLHYLSGGAVGFARGLNDAPKIVAYLMAGEAAAQVHPNLGLALVAVVMAAGGIINARHVAETMSKKITRMSPGQGLTANLVTAVLVSCASRFGLPVSTTHVSVGALFGIGVVNGTARARTIVSILLAWVTTLPLGAVLGALAYLVARALVFGS
jgi:PiT family inorganic phosphate transporter